MQEAIEWRLINGYGELTLLLRVSRKQRGKFDDTSRNNQTNTNKGEHRQGLCMHGKGARYRMEGTIRYDPSVTSTITVLVHHHALTARSLATWPRTPGLMQWELRAKPRQHVVTGAVLLVVAWSPTLKANDGIGICPLGSRVVVVAVVVVILHGLGSTVLGKVDKLLALLPMLVLQGRNGGSYTWVIEVKSLLYGFCHRSPCQHKPCLRHLNSLLLWLFGFVAQHWSNSDPSGIPSDNTFNFVMSLQETSVTQQCQPITERHSISHLFPRYVPNIALSLV
ncbi:hypothetical protein Tco_1136469 [Tanacetum coccineum]|uniref:Uncharacterized protein n=1 Tax=Tanacetum coccineum TaxID=301880 RepID=A0ABQ5DKL1_9ASTR